MNTEIQSRLAGIAQAHNIKLLYACESGSRGWGFPSPDSDYDVRFIYLRRAAAYLSIHPPQDQLSFPISDELDIYGWDLRKVLQLMFKSNVTPFEWLQSPIIYGEEPGFRDALWMAAPHYFNPRSNIHHYLGIAKGALDTASGGELKIKKLFYVLRPLLASKWCLEKNTIAPMHIDPLMTLMPDELQAAVAGLIALKAGVSEGYQVKPDAALAGYIAQEYEAVSQASATLPKSSFDAAALDLLFKKMLTDYADYTGS